jgi:hypothetical protein
MKFYEYHVFIKFCGLLLALLTDVIPYSNGDISGSHCEDYEDDLYGGSKLL